jgi:hypothetical protein
MSLAKGLAVSVVCGGIGAVAWAGLTYATGWQLGLVAVVVGGAAGFGMAHGSGGRGGAQAGLLAALVALVAILAGNFAAAQVMVHKHLSDSGITEEGAINAIAQEIYHDMMAVGETFEGAERDAETGWPVIVSYRARMRWEGMSEESRREFLAAKAAGFRQDMEEAAPLAGLAAFLVMTLHWKSLAIIALGVVTAFRIGSTDAKAEAEARGVALDDEPTMAGAHFGSPGSESPTHAGAVAVVDDELAAAGYRLPPMREPAEDNLPSIEEIMRKHAAAQHRGGGDAERAEAA